MTTEFTIPRVPLSPNRMLRMHWAKRRKEQNSWVPEMFASLSPENTEWMRLWARRDKKVKVKITVHHKRLFDPDNLYGSVKFILDVMRHLGFLKDDSPKWLKLKVYQRLVKKPRQPRTVIQVGPEE